MQKTKRRPGASQPDEAVEESLPLGYQPVHVVMRYTEKFLGVADTVAEHERILRRRGAVALGKFGRPLGAPWVERLNRQISAGFSTSLFLVKRIDDGYAVHKLNVKRVTRKPDEKINRLFPSYYAEQSVLARMSMWFVCDAVVAVKPNVLDALHIASSGYSVRRAIHTSMAGLFVVRDGPGLGYL
jgi:hypothetical protein